MRWRMSLYELAEKEEDEENGIKSRYFGFSTLWISSSICLSGEVGGLNVALQ